METMNLNSREAYKKMTEARPSAPDNAVPVQKMEDMDDDLPF